MTTYKDPNYGSTPVADRAADAIIKRYTWVVSKTSPGTTGGAALANGDKILIGQLPAGHFLVPELCAGIANAFCPALHYSIAVDADANLMFSSATVAANTFKKDTGNTDAFALIAETLGVSTLNRDIYFIIDTAPTTDGTVPFKGRLTAQIGYAPQLDKPVS